MQRATFLPRAAGDGALVRGPGGLLGLRVFGEFLPLPMGGGAFGTLSTLDELAAVRQSVAQYGEDLAWQSIALALEAHNRQVADMLGALVERTTDVQRAYGTSDTKKMQEMDQWGRPDAQKVTAGVTVGFPLRRYGDSLQWTLQWMRQNSGAQLAAEVAAIMDADAANVIRAIKAAWYTPTNYSFVDKLGGGNSAPNVTLAVKALVNNDGAGLPVGPNGEVFATSHTHYLATASLTAADLTNLIETVMEHHAVGQPVVYINRAQEAAVRALTGFVGYVDARILPGGGTTTQIPAGGVTLEQRNLYDRAIGVFGAAEVWVKPWTVSGYAVSFVRGAPSPFAMRVPVYAGLADLQLVAEDESHPLRARTYERQFGIGAWTRTAAAVLYTGGGSYVAPTIA
jgi:hypothetical protein